jgi:hypothetical protein
LSYIWYIPSIFLRDTTNTTLCSASGQLRLRDAKNIHLFVGSEAEPIIEASIGIHIGPYALSYEGIEGEKGWEYYDKIPIE